jgi:hypothetical protein
MPITYLSLKKGKPVEYRDAIHASIKNALLQTFALSAITEFRDR